MPITNSTATAIEQRDVPTTSQFRFGLHEEKPIDLSPVQEDVLGILDFRAQSAVRAQKLHEEGLAGGRSATELDQATAEIVKKLKENENGLNELSSPEIAQVYFVLRDIAEQKPNGAYYQDLVKNVRNPEDRRKMIAKEKKRVDRLVGGFERRLVGRNYSGFVEKNLQMLSVDLSKVPGLGVRQLPDSREILKLDDLIRINGGNIEKAAAGLASEQIASVLEERREEATEAIGKDKIEQAKKSVDPAHRAIAEAIEKSADLPSKGIKGRKEIAAWTQADQFRKFISPGFSETELSNDEIILSVAGNNSDLLKAARLAKGGKITKSKTLEELRTELAGLNKKQKKTMADSFVALLAKESSFGGVVDTAYTTLQQLGDKLPETARRTQVVELSAEAGKQAGEADIVLAIADGSLTDQELTARGFDKKAIDGARKKYFYKDAAGQYQLKEVAADDQVKAEEERIKKEIYDDPQLKVQMEREIAVLAQQKAAQDFVLMESSLLKDASGNPIDYDTQILDLAVQMGLSRKGPGGADAKWVPTSAEEVKSAPEFEKVKQRWIAKRNQEQYGLGKTWRGTDEAKMETIDNYMKKPEGSAIAERYYSSVGKMTADTAVSLGTESLAVLKAAKKIKDAGVLIDTKLIAAAKLDQMTDLMDNYGTANQKLKDSPDLAKTLAKRTGVSALFWAMLISQGLVKQNSAFSALLNEGKDKEAERLQSLIA